MWLQNIFVYWNTSVSSLLLFMKICRLFILENRTQFKLGESYSVLDCIFSVSEHFRRRANLENLLSEYSSVDTFLLAVISKPTKARFNNTIIKLTSLKFLLVLNHPEHLARCCTVQSFFLLV